MFAAKTSRGTDSAGSKSAPASMERPEPARMHSGAIVGLSVFGAVGQFATVGADGKIVVWDAGAAPTRK
jgi:hypothetical protein